MGQIELDSGDLGKAARWFDQADLDQAHADETLAGASTFALRGEFASAERLFARVDDARNRSLRLNDLRVRLAVNPIDAAAAGELQRLSTLPFDPPPNTVGSATKGPVEDGRGSPATSGPELYALHCAACHGADGDGNGPAARHLFPRPRDLRTGKSRLVSTRNGVPTLEDLEAGIRQGMPGTAMAPFENLTEDQRMLLAREVLRLNREGIRQQFISTLKSEGEEIDEDEVHEVVELCTTPGDVVAVPQIGPPDPQTIARGKDTYFELSCDNCHGADGTGAWDTPWFDDKGRHSPPRDLVHEPFKGGPEPESIYLRVLLGMPGTPHPACYNVAEEQLIGLVHYCRWLSREPKRVLTNHQRAIEATSRVYLTPAGPAATP
jgi:mono/diheme cytochrome c family protein